MKRVINIFDKIGALIPGYKGYQDREGRRECDRQLREQIADELYEIEKKVSKLIDDAEFSELNQIEKNRKKINNLKDSIKYSPYGASTFFSDSVVDKLELEKIYQMDLNILDCVEKLKSNINNDKNSNLNEFIQKIEDSIYKRNQFIKDK